MPAVDIIMPSYNGARYLRTAIESLIVQTVEDWCLVLIDDGSSDDTDAIAAEYLERLGSRMIYLKQANAGPSAARNRGIRASSSPLVAMLDSDDVWTPDRLERSIAAFAGRPQVGLSYGLISWINPAGEVTHTFAGNPSRYAEGRIAPYLYMRAVDLPCCSVTLRRAALDEVGLFDESLRATEDRDLWLRVALKFEVAFIPQIIAFYRTSPASATTDPDRMLNAQLNFIQKHAGAAGCGFRARRVALSTIFRQRAEFLAGRRRLGEALRSAAHAFVLYPLDVRNARTAFSSLLRAVRLVR